MRDVIAYGIEVEFEAAQPVKQDALQVMEWRNDPDTLAASFHPTPKIFSSFWPEFCASYFAFPDFPPLFAVSEGKRCAFLRFRPTSFHLKPDQRFLEVSIMVAPGLRGRGIGKEALTEMALLARGKNIDGFYAEIKKGNIASTKTFESACYVALDDAVKELEGGKTCEIHRYYLCVNDQSCE